jgi:hypothetical protein
MKEHWTHPDKHYHCRAERNRFFAVYKIMNEIVYRFKHCFYPTKKTANPKTVKVFKLAAVVFYWPCLDIDLINHSSFILSVFST